MISYLNGLVRSKNGNTVLLVVGGVGYSVMVPQSLLSEFVLEQEVELFVKTYVRDDHIALYGFASPDVLSMFELLTTVSGVGPKMALAVFDVHAPSDIHRAIHDERVEAFTAVSGIGKKNASRIILELKSKLGSEASLATLTGAQSHELVEALGALGYGPREIESMIRGVPTDMVLDEQLKLALKNKQ